MKVVYTDSLVIGGGLAGLRTAIATKMRGLDTIVLSLIPAKRSHSAAAQGGMQASLAAAIKSEGDNEDVHFSDTVKGSDWGCDQDVARMFAQCAPKAARELSAWGVPWTRVRRGPHQVIINAEKVTINEKDEAHGLITARDFGGTKNGEPVTPRTAPDTQCCMRWTTKAIELGIPVHERKEAIALIHDGKTVLRRRGPRPHHRRTHRLCVKSDHHRDRRLRPDLFRVDKRRNQRRHRMRDRARNRRRRPGQHGSGPVSPDGNRPGGNSHHRRMPR